MRAQAALKADFEATRRELAAKGLPAEILAHHDEVVRQFEQCSAQFNQISQRVASEQPGAVEELDAFFVRHPNSKRAAPASIQPIRRWLPWRTPEATTRLPAETQTSWYQNLYGHESRRLAQAGGSDW